MYRLYLLVSSFVGHTCPGHLSVGLELVWPRERPIKRRYVVNAHRGRIDAGSEQQTDDYYDYYNKSTKNRCRVGTRSPCSTRPLLPPPADCNYNLRNTLHKLGFFKENVWVLCFRFLGFLGFFQFNVQWTPYTKLRPRKTFYTPCYSLGLLLRAHPWSSVAEWLECWTQVNFTRARGPGFDQKAVA